jgi:hypothetical protein
MAMGEMDPGTRLVGAWSLISWQIFGDTDLLLSEPYGSRPAGLLQYTADGWMSASISHAERPALPVGISPRRISAELLADAWRSYFHYAGRWRIEADCVIHSVTQSLNPNMVGTEQVRHMHFGPATLTLTGMENVGQNNRRHELLWHRADGQVEAQTRS